VDFDGSTGIVTGAGSGIGRSTALLLAGRGAYVAVADAHEQSGVETVELIRAAGGNADFIRCDVTSAGEVSALVDAVVARRGRLDFAHNNAGIAPVGARIDELTEDVFDRVVAVNLKGVWLCMKYELRVMRRQRSGAIVNTASISGLVAAAMASPYNATKHAVVGLTKEAAVEFGRLGVRVNSVCPGYVDTPMSRTATPRDVWERNISLPPLGRGCEPEEVAEAVAWMLSDAASYVTGHGLVVDGGLISQMAPPMD
jgi:NAD(P)-dependent dehydrogenase (short-subunit alcohol dehydrogenase family)